MILGRTSLIDVLVWRVSWAITTIPAARISVA